MDELELEGCGICQGALAAGEAHLLVYALNEEGGRVQRPLHVRCLIEAQMRALTGELRKMIESGELDVAGMNDTLAAAIAAAVEEYL